MGAGDRSHDQPCNSAVAARFPKPGVSGTRSLTLMMVDQKVRKCKHSGIRCVCGMPATASSLNVAVPGLLNCTYHPITGHLGCASCGRKGLPGRKGAGNRRPILRKTLIFHVVRHRNTRITGRYGQNIQPLATRRDFSLFWNVYKSGPFDPPCLATRTRTRTNGEMSG